MTIAASGNAVSFSALRTEFVGGSSSISLSALYRGGSNILSKAGDNPAVNLAASVPTSGAIDFSDFHSTAKGFKNTISSNTTNVDADALFGDDYDVNYPKIIDINSGVTIGGNGDEALDIPSGLASTLTINNAGNIYGFGGAAGGGAGGSAINCAASNVTINNTGEIRGGGGGGGNAGAGGNGGNGQTSSTSSVTQVLSGPSYSSSNHIYIDTEGGSTTARFNGSYYFSSASRVITIGGVAWTYFGNGVYISYYYRGVSRTGNVTTYTSTSGGAGGAGGSGGVGQGYNQSNTNGASGSSGSSGGTNAGSGGAGGTGGNGSTWATAGGTGGTGSTGGNGNVSNGASGSSGGSGGAAGAAVSGSTSVTMNNTGTISGTVA